MLLLVCTAFCNSLVKLFSPFSLIKSWVPFINLSFGQTVQAFMGNAYWNMESRIYMKYISSGAKIGPVVKPVVSVYFCWI